MIYNKIIPLLSYTSDATSCFNHSRLSTLPNSSSFFILISHIRLFLLLLLKRILLLHVSIFIVQNTNKLRRKKEMDRIFVQLLQQSVFLDFTAVWPAEPDQAPVFTVFSGSLPVSRLAARFCLVLTTLVYIYSSILICAKKKKSFSILFNTFFFIS